MLSITRIGKTANHFFKSTNLTYCLSRGIKGIDKSLFPTLNEADLEEHFIKGSGPGGQSVNKSTNTVYLVHKPSGLSVKVHESRLLQDNRKIARQRLSMQLDELINGENSIKSQEKRLLQEKSKKRQQKQKKLNDLKSQWKKLMSEHR